MESIINIEIVPYQDEEEGATYDTDSKGST